MSEVDTGPAAAIDASRARGDHRHDPVRFRFIEALASRAAAHRGAARRILDDRLMQLLREYGEALEAARCREIDAPEIDLRKAAPQGHALAGLLDHIAQSKSSNDESSSTAQALKYFRSTWLRLSTDRRMTQAQATVPDNPGPLNSHHLVHQALQSMRTLSPGYLDHFMTYVDALLWLDSANAAAVAPAVAPREASAKRTVRKKTS